MKGTFINISSEKKTMSVIYGYWQRHLLYSTLTYLTGKKRVNGICTTAQGEK